MAATKITSEGVLLDKDSIAEAGEDIRQVVSRFIQRSDLCKKALSLKSASYLMNLYGYLSSM